jgi:hypothetical protein
LIKIRSKLLLNFIKIDFKLLNFLFIFHVTSSLYFLDFYCELCTEPCYRVEPLWCSVWRNIVWFSWVAGCYCDNHPLSWQWWCTLGEIYFVHTAVLDFDCNLVLTLLIVIILRDSLFSISGITGNGRSWKPNPHYIENIEIGSIDFNTIYIWHNISVFKVWAAFEKIRNFDLSFI